MRTVLALALCLLAEPVGAHHNQFVLVNAGSVAITGFRVVPSDRRGEVVAQNLLGETIPPGDSRRVEPDESKFRCMFDVEVRYADGFSRELRALDLCMVREIVSAGGAKPFQIRSAT